MRYTLFFIALLSAPFIVGMDTTTQQWSLLEQAQQNPFFQQYFREFPGEEFLLTQPAWVEQVANPHHRFQDYNDFKSQFHCFKVSHAVLTLLPQLDETTNLYNIPAYDLIEHLIDTLHQRHQHRSIRARTSTE